MPYIPYYAMHEQLKVFRCDDYTKLSFQGLAEHYFSETQRPAHSFRRFLAIMRKAGARFMIEEQLSLEHNDFCAEKAEIESVLRSVQNLPEDADIKLDMRAERLTFFSWLPSAYIAGISKKDQEGQWSDYASEPPGLTEDPPPLIDDQPSNHTLGYAVIVTVSFPLSDPKKAMYNFSPIIHKSDTYEQLKKMRPDDISDCRNAARYLELPFSVEMKKGELWGKTSYIFEAGIERLCRDAEKMLNKPSASEQKDKEPEQKDKEPNRVPVQDRFIHAYTDLPTVIGTKARHREYRFEASLFHEQSAISSSCGHMAILTALNSSYEFTHGNGKHIGHAELYAAIKRAKENRSEVTKLEVQPPLLDHLVITTVLKEFAHESGFQLHTISFKKQNPGRTKFRETIYPAMESGYPVILNFAENAKGDEVESHSVAILGHTQDSDSWLNLGKLDSKRDHEIKTNAEGSQGDQNALAPTRVISVTEWQNSLILSDDTNGPHLDISPEKLIDHECSFQERIFSLDTAHYLLPQSIAPDVCSSFQEKTFENNRIIEKIIKKCRQFLLEKPDENAKENDKKCIKWLERLYLGPIVIRPLLVSKERYVHHLVKLATTHGKDGEHHGITEEKRNHVPAPKTSMRQKQKSLALKWPPMLVKTFMDLPEYVMVVEVSLPYIYDGNKHKMMDVVFDATDAEMNSRVKKILFWGVGVGGKMGAGKKDEVERCSLPPHVPYIRTSILHEW